MLLLRDFNRRFTLRRLTMYGSPVVKPVSAVTLPKGSVLHYFNPESVEIGPPGTLYHLNQMDKLPRVRHHQLLPSSGTVGLPIEIKRDLKEDILSYHRKWKTLGRYRTKELVDNDPKVLMVENYAPILKKYRYDERINLWYDISYNQLNAVVTGLEESIKDFPDRQHYLPVNLPSTIPGKNKLEKMIFSQTRQVWGDLGSYSMLLFIHLYAWVGDSKEREQSIFSRFTTRELKHLNLMLEFKGNFSNINLAELDGWRREGKKGKVMPIEMQKRLRETIRVILESTPIATKNIIDPENGEINYVEEDYEEDYALEVDDEELESELEKFSEKTKDIDENEDIVIVEDEVPEILVGDYSTTDGVIETELEKIRKHSPNKHEKWVNKWQSVKDIATPYGDTYGNSIVLTEEDKIIEETPFIVGDKRFEVKGWNASRNKEYLNKYTSSILKKDIVRMCYAAQKAGFVIDEHEMEEKLTVSGHKEEHKLRVTILEDGKSGTLPFVIPKIDKDGYWTANGVKYTMRPQRVDEPIRKVGPLAVALTTFYGKVFVEACQKKVANWGSWVVDSIRLADKDNEDNRITNVSYSNVYDNKVKLPREYALVSMEIDSLVSGNWVFNFDHKKIESKFTKDVVERLEEESLTPVAKNRYSVLAMDDKSAMYIYDRNTKDIKPTSDLIDILQLPSDKAPKEFTEANILDNKIPIGLILGYYWGIEGLLKETKTRYEFLPPGERGSGDGISLQLKEGRLEIYPASREQELIFNGYLRYKDVIKTLTLRELGTKGAFALMFDKDKIGNSVLTELDLLETSFVDPIREDMLRAMGEPTEFKGLLLRANQLMDTVDHPNETDIEHQIIMVHQRIAGHIYKEQISAIRRYKNAPPSTRKLDLKPKAVWQAIESDKSVLVAQEANAIQPSKEADVVTFGGGWGRSRRSMVRRTRVYDKKELGIISGDTVDSTDVAITSMMSNNANIVDIYGRVKITENVNDLEYGELFSFCNALAPDVDTDDSKRQNFVGIHLGSARSSKGAKATPYRTTAFMTLAHKTSSSFATIAEDDGVVKEVNEYGITVKYKGGDEKSYPLNKWYGSYEGGVYPHDMATTFKVGDKISAKDVLTYAADQFEPDPFNKRQVNWRAGIMATVALINSEEVFEDSDEISESLASKHEVSNTKIVETLLSFNQNVLDMIKVGSKIDYDTPLAIIDESNDYDGYSDEAIMALSEISSSMPMADVKGVVEKIEVVYNGEYETMSESVQHLAKRGDRQRRNQAKHSTVPLPTDGKVGEDYKVKGNPLREGQMLIRFFVTYDSVPGGGDKLELANQMKTIIRARMTGENYAEGNVPIDLKFGREGVDNRIVASLYHIGLKSWFCWGVGKECREIRDS